MGTQERKEREREEQRKRILEAAGEIIAEEGVDRLSIRKIANRIEYSPGSIYHYFENKEAIIEQLLNEGYRKILGSIRPVDVPEDQPEQVIRQSLRQYIEMALRDPDLFKSVLLSESPSVLSHTSVLFQGALGKRQTFSMMLRPLMAIESMMDKDEPYIERTAQVIWSSTFGLIIRLIIEKDLPEEQKLLLIERHIELMMAGIS